MNSMPITMLDGLGCSACSAEQGLGLSRGRVLRGIGGAPTARPLPSDPYTVMGFQNRMQMLSGLHGVSDYDQIKIGGKTYTVNQILDKTVVASVDTKTYSRPGGTVLSTVKAGQPIGIVYSYLRPDQSNTGGKSWLMFESSYNKFYYVPNEVVSGSGLKEQGTKTVTEEIKEEKDKQLKNESPIEYYVSKYAWKVGLVLGAVYLGSVVIREVTRGVVEKKIKPATT